MKIKRKLEDKELEFLSFRLKQIRQSNKNQIKFLTIWTLLAVVVGTYAFFKMDTKNEVVELIVFVLIYIGIGVWVVLEQYIKSQKQTKSINFLKQQNKVTSIKVISDKYFEFEEEDDDGVFYLFQLDNDFVFSFGGQDFYPTENFPSDNFEIVEGRGIRNEIVLLEIYNNGKKLHPLKTISGKDKWTFLDDKNYPDPFTLTVAKGKIEDYCNLLSI